MFALLFNPLSVAFTAALLPVALMWWYIYRQDSAQPEPISWLWKSVLYGVYSAILTMLVMGVIPSIEDLAPAFAATIPGAVCNAFCYAAIPEEAAKLLLLYLVIRKNPYFDEHLDGIVYATCVGLGFAGLENILYLLTNMDSLVSVAVGRALFSVPGHFFFAVVMGYFVSLGYYETSKEKSRMYYILAYLAPVMLHGIFDALLMSSTVSEEWAALCLVLFLIFVVWMRRQGIKKIKKLKEKDLIAS